MVVLAEVPVSARRVHILLAEDNPGDVYLIRLALQEQGLDFDLHVVGDGEAAMAWIGNGRPAGVQPDLVLLDLNLPRHHGREVLRAFRASEATAQVPIAILTSSDSPSDVADTERLGATYLRKPAGLDDFMALGSVIRRLLGDT